jgi:CysZ protein
LGRELTETGRLRHRDERGVPLPDLSFATRFVLGGICVALLTVPVVNLLASVVGAAMATHLVHRRRAV